MNALIHRRTKHKGIIHVSSHCVRPFTSPRVFAKSVVEFKDFSWRSFLVLLSLFAPNAVKCLYMCVYSRSEPSAIQGANIRVSRTAAAACMGYAPPVARVTPMMMRVRVSKPRKTFRRYGNGIRGLMRTKTENRRPRIW
jgi:hypothetical protein